MKKSLLLGLLLTISNGIFGYSLTIKNNLVNSPIRAEIDKVWASNEEKYIQPGQSHTFTTGAACIAGVFVQNIWADVTKKLSTSGGGCRNYNVEVNPVDKNDPNNSVFEVVFL